MTGPGPTNVPAESAEADKMVFHAEYRQEWIAAGYRGDEGSACAVKPPPEGYRAAYHFTEAKYAMCNIKNKRIKATRISEANDPFEFEGFQVLSDPLRDEIRKLKAETNATLCVLCFSKDWRSPALWAHYANRHKGICLGFWAKKLETLLEVNYYTDRVESGLEGRPFSPSAKMKERLVTNKAQDWFYEEEIRRCVNVNETFEDWDGKRFFKFDHTLSLSEVIIGEKCTVNLDKVRELVRENYEHDVEVYKARSAYRSFKMVPDL
jgi:Protein of unknown function (DUF2971)